MHVPSMGMLTPWPWTVTLTFDSLILHNFGMWHFLSLRNLESTMFTVAYDFTKSNKITILILFILFYAFDVDGMDRLQAGSPCLQVSAGEGYTVVPRRRTLPASRHRGSTSSTFCLVTVADCPPYAAVNRRWSSLSGRCPSCLERSSAARHINTVTGHLPQSPQDSSLQALLPVSALLSRPMSDMSLRTR